MFSLAVLIGRGLDHSFLLGQASLRHFLLILSPHFDLFLASSFIQFLGYSPFFNPIHSDGIFYFRSITLSSRNEKRCSLNWFGCADS